MQPNAPQRSNQEPEHPRSTTLAILVIVLTLVVIVTALIAFKLIVPSN